MIHSSDLPLVSVFLLLIRLLVSDAAPIHYYSPATAQALESPASMVITAGYLFTSQGHAEKINQAGTLTVDAPMGAEEYRYLYAKPSMPSYRAIEDPWICHVTFTPDSNFTSTPMLFVPEYFQTKLAAYANSQEYDARKTILFAHLRHHHMLLLPPLYVSPSVDAAHPVYQGSNPLGLKAFCEPWNTFKPGRPDKGIAPWHEWPISQWPRHGDYPDQRSSSEAEIVGVGYDLDNDSTVTVVGDEDSWIIVDDEDSDSSATVVGNKTKWNIMGVDDDKWNVAGVEDRWKMHKALLKVFAVNRFKNVKNAECS